jgi:hypothetical protein
MKKVIAAICSALLLTVVIVNPASAHVLKTDGTIGVVLHIQPDDNPTAGVVTTYQLAFDDTSGQFNLKNCDCGVSVQQNGATIDTGPLVVSSSLASTDTYTFKTPDVYTLVISGKPKSGNSFQPFSLSYLVRVEVNGQMNAQPFPLTLGIGFGLMTVLLLLVAVKADGMLE